MADILVLRRVLTGTDGVNRSYPKEAAEADVLTHSGMKSSTTMDLSLTATGTAGLLNDGFTTAVVLGGSVMTQLDLGVGAAVTAINIGTNVTPGKTITIGADTDDATVINGDLTVTGNTTTVNTTNLTVLDTMILLNSDGVAPGPAGASSGVAGERGATGLDWVILWNETSDAFELGIADTVAGTSTPGAITTSNFASLTIGDSLKMDAEGAGAACDITTTSGDSLTVTATGATTDLTLGARGNTITLNQVGDLTYSGSATSIIGALNENRTAIGAADSWAEVLTVGGGISGTTSPTITSGQSLLGADELTLASTTTGAVVLDSGTTGTISIGVDGTNAKNVLLDSGTTGTIGIGTSAFAKAITIGNSTTTTAVIVNTGTGDLALGTNATAHEVSLGSATGVSGVTIVTGTGGVNVGANGIAAEVTIGNSTGISGVTVNAGTGGIDIGTGTPIMTVNIATGGTGAKTLVMGGLDSTSASTLRTGTGILLLDANGVLEIDAEDNSTINVSGDLTILLDETQTGDGSANGNAFLATSGVGALTTGASAAGTGGATGLTAGAGGAGSATAAAGDGGDACLRAGAKGAAGAGGEGNHGRTCFTSGSIEYFLTALPGTTGDAAPVIAGSSGTTTVVEAINANAAAIAAAGSTLQETYTAQAAAPVTGALLLDFDLTAAIRLDSTVSINIGDDADAAPINIGTGVAAKTITVGNSTGATQLILNSGTAGIDIGTNAVAQIIDIGNATGATAINLDSGTGGVNVGANASVHEVTIGASTGASGVTINTGSGGINVGTNGIAATLTLGNAIGASAVDINSGTGGVTIDAAATGDIALTVADDATSDITFQAHGSAVIEFNGATATVGDVGNKDLGSSFTATTIIGALNELKISTTSAGDLQNSYTAAVLLLAGDCVYISAVDTVNKASATSFSAVASNYIGVCEDGHAIGTGAIITTEGVVAARFENSLTLAFGEEVWLSATSGLFTNVPPATGGNVQLSVGFIKNSTVTASKGAYVTATNPFADVQLVRGSRMAV